MGDERGSFRVGTSGWQYDHWSGRFYPDDLPKDEWFGYYAQHFDTVEVNNTFYHLPEPETFDDWFEQAPEGFCYVLKFSRYGTHLKHLKDPEDTIGLFMERARRLGPTLGPILVQLRPNWHVNVERLAGFLEAAPEDQRWAVEFRDETWLCDEVFDLLREHEAALCIHDMIEDHPREVTADWVYLRYHGADTWGDYSHQALSAQAQIIQDYLDRGLDVYAYFNNDANAYSVSNATDLRRYVEDR
ncbi:MAG: DUF72 domain-containing protein [Candidatus Brocadiia bacterium]